MKKKELLLSYNLIYFPHIYSTKNKIYIFNEKLKYIIKSTTYKIK